MQNITGPLVFSLKIAARIAVVLAVGFLTYIRKNFNKELAVLM